MRQAEALSAALAMLREPRLARSAERCRLPKGVTLLLEIAAGETEALARAAAITGRSEAALKKAAGFFIEQVLLSPDADSYRILGAEQEAPEVELRRHMALLLRWLHPDLSANGTPGQRFDKSAYASRVTKAWDMLKTLERRSAYDATLAKARNQPVRADVRKLHPAADGAGKTLFDKDKHRQIKVYRLQGESFWNRLLLLFARRR